ncbi:MAG TPA: isoleucine--tRNA ligase [Candidatus Nanoarchaeia archaeon]|nr:isoleucine--tRNA ligase [Candidatus Nanoarchaeia archaeon]
MQFPDYNAQQLEPQILEFWKKNKVLDTLRKRNQKGKKFYFLQGPPYTSGQIHLGHAWNMSLKDMALRYKRSQGFNVWDRMGYDMHGLPTEQKTMARLGLHNKEEIEKFGLKKFTQECEKFCIEMMHKMDEDFQRLGATLDFSDPYQPIKKEFMEAEWWLIQQAHDKKRLYQGLRTMHWDAATQTAVAKHELEYKKITDTSIYLKFQSKEDPKKFYLVWTTTPWTIPLNLAIMVNPDLTYAEVSVNNEVWVIAENLVSSVLAKAKAENHKTLRKYKGSELEGKKYLHPLQTQKYLPAELQKNSKLFSILLTKEFVDDSAGTGLVHCAPGCGPEDYEVGYRHGLMAFNCVNESGHFENFGPFNGWKAKSDDKKFIQILNEAQVLVAKESYSHDYPHGERSHEPVIFRTTKQWFFKVEDLKEKMIAANQKISWNPQTAKQAFKSWLENLRDNSITKQRYWGTAVPIWQADDGDYLVIGSVKELEKISGQKVTNMHIPEIDKIVIKKNNKIYRRVPDVLDVWIDAGTVSWNCLNYPQDTKLFKQYFPADFIAEGKDQVRGWFNLLMVASFLAFNKPSFKNVYMNGFVTDVDGEKMSKSLGNIISPYELIDKHGADTLRYYMCQTNAGEDINFSWDECKAKVRSLLVLWNTHKLLINLSKETKVNPFSLKPAAVEKNLELEEKYIFSRLHSVIQQVTTLLDQYRLDEVIAPIEELFLELSRTYIQMIREKSTSGTEEEKQACVYTIGQVLLQSVKMFNIVAPFISEAIYQNLKDEFGAKLLPEESIMHCSWPSADKKKINKKLEEHVSLAQGIIQAGLHAREKAKLGVRWPVKEVQVISENPVVKNVVAKLQDVICSQLNAKIVTTAAHSAEMQVKIKPDYAKIGPAFGKLSPQIIAKLALDSPQSIMNHLQKEGKYSFTINNQAVEVTPEMVIAEREAPHNYQLSEYKDLLILVNTERTEELEAEGYAREAARNIQDLRKNAGMQKTDKIILYLKTSLGMQKMLKPLKNEMQLKVGAHVFDLVVVEPQRKYKEGGKFKVKEEEFTAYFEKL